MDAHKRLLARLEEKVRLRNANDARHERIRPLLVICGGGMRGVGGGAIVTALNKMGLNTAFDVVVGASAGAPIATYFIAGYEQSKLGTSLFYEELASKKFFSLLRMKNQLDVAFMGSFFREGEKKLDITTVKNHVSTLYVSVTDYLDGNNVLYDVKKLSDIVYALEASCAMPLLNNDTYILDERRALDGYISFSLWSLLRRFRNEGWTPTDIVIIPNCSTYQMRPRAESFWRVVLSVFPHHFEHGILQYFTRGTDVEFLEDSLICDGEKVVLYSHEESEKEISTFSVHGSRLYTYADATYRQTLGLFGKGDLYEPLPHFNK